MPRDIVYAGNFCAEFHRVGIKVGNAPLTLETETLSVMVWRPFVVGAGLNTFGMTSIVFMAPL